MVWSRTGSSWTIMRSMRAGNLRSRRTYRKLMVIDDLADREHIADLLLDQNLVDGMENRYQGKVPGHCICLVGPQYALLRPEFSMLRPASLARRKTPALNRLLIFMGGSDPDDETGKVLDGVMLSRKPWEHIDVVVGESHSALQTLKDTLANLPVRHAAHPDARHGEIDGGRGSGRHCRRERDLGKMYPRTAQSRRHPWREPAPDRHDDASARGSANTGCGL
jgi:hypothetical protein